MTGRSDRRLKTVAWIASFAVYVAVGYWLQVRHGFILGDALSRVFEQRYAQERFIRVMPFDNDANVDDGFFDVQGSNDTNCVDIFVFGNKERVVLMARLDNLGKGASGAAVQAMNVHLGVEESLGLV